MDTAFAKAEALVTVGPAPTRDLAARWAIATGDPDYEGALSKLVADPTHGHLTWTAGESKAYTRVAGVQAEQKAMGLTDASGGFMVPFTLDPSVILTSAGSVNPLRQISRVVTAVTDQWAGVTSTRPDVAEWLAEATQAADATPVLAQPNIPVHKGSVFTPFSVRH